MQLQLAYDVHVTGLPRTASHNQPGLALSLLVADFGAPLTGAPAWLTVEEGSVGRFFGEDFVRIQNAIRVHQSLELPHEVELQGAVLLGGVVTL